MSNEKSSMQSPEFQIIWIMLMVLLCLIVVVLWTPIYFDGESTTSKDVMDFRYTIIALLITTFGAWIGAGAAYYYGKDNLKKATDTILSMKEPSPEEILARTRIGDIDLKNIGFTASIDDDAWPVYEYLKKRTFIWFVPIVNKDGSLRTTLKDEAVYHFVDTKLRAEPAITINEAVTKVKTYKVKDILDYLKTKRMEKSMRDIAIIVEEDFSAALALEMMEKKGVNVSIVTDEKGKPLKYINTADIRRILV